MEKISAEFEIERLLQFARQKSIIKELDIITSRNALMDLFKLEEPYTGKIPDENLESPVDILQNLLDYASEIDLLEENTTTYRDLLDTKIMGLIMPRQSEVVEAFWNTATKEGTKKATQDYYEFSKASNYIRTNRISKNISWKYNSEFGDLDITINLSKPEKDPKYIIKAKSRSKSKYPKCLLCVENIGYQGSISHPARQNHRVIPVRLNDESWYLQYSPYVYYNEHSIVFKGSHEPMSISGETFKRLLDFVEQFPHYFLGSNADLPIVGGSILSHEHYQGGNYTFAMEKAPVKIEFYDNRNTDINIGIVKWSMSVIRLSGKNKDKLIELSTKLLDSWRGYNDEGVDILAYTDGEERIYHNTITPIARVNEIGDYEVDLILRNNRASEEHPDGIFHPHKELHHIKKENIGLIECMGLAVLPGRLKEELNSINKILLGELPFNRSDYDETHHLYKHRDWIEQLIDKYGVFSTEEEATYHLKQEVGLKFLETLKHAGVYKNDERGTEAFIKFMLKQGFRLKTEGVNYENKSN